MDLETSRDPDQAVHFTARKLQDILGVEVPPAYRSKFYAALRNLRQSGYTTGWDDAEQLGDN